MRAPVGILAVLAVACSARHHVPVLVGRPILDRQNVLLVEPRQSYRLAFATPIDDLPLGTRWTSTDLRGSPLAYMEQRPVIYKADDFGGTVSKREARFIDLVDSEGGVAALGIITSRLSMDPEAIATFRSLDAHGYELWFHGHTHHWALPEAEFAGVGVEQMERSLGLGLERGRRVLGIEFHTFGAPGNAIDENTGVALAKFPELAVWLYGKPGYGQTVEPYRISLERSVGKIQDVDVFLHQVDEIIAQPFDGNPLVLQLHPRMLHEEDFLRLERIVHGLTDRGFRTTTPYGWRCWQCDRGLITLAKVDPAAYDVALADARYAHRLESDPRGPLPVAFVRRPAPSDLLRAKKPQSMSVTRP